MIMIKTPVRLQMLVSLLITILLAGDLAGFWPTRVSERLEWLSYDLRVQSSLINDVDPGLVVIDIDERSLAELGQWPWSRHLIADLIETLFQQHGMSLLGIDVVFSEAENFRLADDWDYIRSLYPELPETVPLPSGDERLARSIADWPIVTGFYFAGPDPAYPDAVRDVGLLPPALQIVNAGWEQFNIPWVRAERFTGNLPLLQEAANATGSGGGFFDNPVVDHDGVFRRVPLVQQAADGLLYPNLPLAMLLELLGNPPVELIANEGGGTLQLEGIDVGGFVIPTDMRGVALVPWYGPERHFRYVSAIDVLSGQVEPASLQGAIGILGTSAPGLKDLRSTPVGAVYPGAEINLSLMAGMLHQRFLAEPAYAQAGAVLLILLLGTVISLGFPWLSALWVLVAGSFLLLGYTAFNLWMWQQSYLLPLAPAVLLVLLLTGWHLLGNYWRESRRTQLVTSRFGQYVPPELVTDMVKADYQVSMDGEERNMTVLFSDIRDFTAFAENVTPSQLGGVMNRLLTPLTHAIHRQHGTIDKYMGDAVMAFWGAPLPDPDHAHHALVAAFAMQDALREINRSFVEEGLPALAMGIGVHSGDMNVGNMGSAFRMAYTVLGDNVNLGSRVEGLTKIYGVDVLCTEDTRQKADAWCYRPIDRVRVKGREQPVMLYAPLALNADVTPGAIHLRDLTEQALALYWTARFDESLTCWQDMLQRYPHDKLATVFAERCCYYLKTAPAADWDGVWTHTSK